MNKHKWFPHKFIEVFNTYCCSRYVKGTENNKFPEMNICSDSILTTFYLN